MLNLSPHLSLLSYVEPDDPDRSEVELRLKRKWSDGSESLIFSQRAKKFNSRGEVSRNYSSRVV